jgi:hypothetical protein
MSLDRLNLRLANVREFSPRQLNTVRLVDRCAQAVNRHAHSVMVKDESACQAPARLTESVVAGQCPKDFRDHFGFVAIYGNRQRCSGGELTAGFAVRYNYRPAGPEQSQQARRRLSGRRITQIYARIGCECKKARALVVHETPRRNVPVKSELMNALAELRAVAAGASQDQMRIRQSSNQLSQRSQHDL